MKICKTCKEPKFEFQMYKVYSNFIGIISEEKTPYCKRCIKKTKWEAVIKKLKNK